MAIITKTCKICGKKYEGCTNAEKYDGVFRYQTVACSPECGAIYLAQIMKSRGAEQESSESEQIEPAKKTRKKSVKKNKAVESSAE